VAALFVFFFTWFMILHNTSAAHMCPETAEAHTTASMWDKYIQDTINSLA
jgi:hypothetical protein